MKVQRTTWNSQRDKAKRVDSSKEGEPPSPGCQRARWEREEIILETRTAMMMTLFPSTVSILVSIFLMCTIDKTVVAMSVKLLKLRKG